jgi:type IV pilus assembly protein PilC
MKGAWHAPALSMVGKNAPGKKKKVSNIASRQKAVTVFSRQMATLLDAGLPIVRSLETLVRQQRDPKFRTVLQDVAEQVRSGSTFSDALAQYPKIFDGLLLNMVRAGEAAGNLHSVLARVAEFREKAEKIKGKVQAAMVYPIIVITVAALIVGALMVYVVPKFEAIFAGMLRGQSLPPLTQLVIGFSRGLGDYLPFVLIGLVLAFFGFSYLLKTKAGKSAWDRFLYYCPGPRALVQRTAIARFTRTFGALVESGVPILEAIRITREVVGNTVVQQALDKVHDRVRDGDSIATPLEQSAVFPAIVPSMVEVGEETGQLPAMCDRIADAYEEEVDNAVGALTSILEPMMIVLLAVVVGTVVIALFLPIVSIIQNLGGGR